jgi:F-type H+-transporting ATPase subunit delta
MSYRIATRYAKSLIQLAQEKGKLEEVFAGMKSLDRAFENSRELKLLFKSPIITSDKKLNVVKSLFENKVDEILFRFLTLMIKKGREEHFHQIAESFITQYNEIKNITPVKITSAVKLDSAFVQSMVASLKKKENLGEVLLQEVVDESLIGGFVLQYGDKMIDSSVIRNLNGLRNIVEDDSYIKKYS